MSTSALIPSQHSTNRLGLSLFVRVILHAVLVAGSLLTLLPFLVMFIGSLVPQELLLSRAFTLADFTIDNYFETFRIIPFGRFYVNSLIVATGTTVIQILTASLAAFAFARLRFRGRNILFILYLATLMIPFQVTMIPNFIITSARYLNLHNSYAGLILPSAFSVFSVFLLAAVLYGHSL